MFNLTKPLKTSDFKENFPLFFDMASHPYEHRKDSKFLSSSKISSQVKWIYDHISFWHSAQKKVLVPMGEQTNPRASPLISSVAEWLDKSIKKVKLSGGIGHNMGTFAAKRQGYWADNPIDFVAASR